MPPAKALPACCSRYAIRLRYILIYAERYMLLLRYDILLMLRYAVDMLFT